MSEHVPAGYRMVRLTAENEDGSRVTNLNVPVRIKLARPAIDSAPVYSGDNGATWRLMNRLDSAVLPDGVEDGYYIDADGDLWVLTRHLSMFGALAPQAIPIEMSTGLPALTVGQTTLLSISGGDGDGVLSAISLTPEICSLADDNTVTALAVGECIIEATKTASGRFIAATNTVSVAVSPAPVVEEPVIDQPAIDAPVEKAKPKKKTSKKDSGTSSIVVPAVDGNDDVVDDAVDDGITVNDGNIDSGDSSDTRGDDGNSFLNVPGVGGTRLLLVLLLLLLIVGGGATWKKRQNNRQEEIQM
jgi:hypothetical protein